MVFRFQKFPVYKDVKKFIKDIYITTMEFPKNERFGLTSQLRNAAISIALNIAEGSDRGSDREFNRFLRIAIGSTNEAVAALDISLENRYIRLNIYNSLMVQAQNIVKQLSSFSKKLRSP